MNYSLTDKAELIIQAIKQETDTDPTVIFRHIAACDFVNIHGPRCCKRDAMVAFECAVEYINNHYDVTLDYNGHTCIYSGLNEQCIKNRCPYFPKKKITL